MGKHDPPSQTDIDREGAHARGDYPELESIWSFLLEIVFAVLIIIFFVLLFTSPMRR